MPVPFIACADFSGGDVVTTERTESNLAPGERAWVKKKERETAQSFGILGDKLHYSLLGFFPLKIKIKVKKQTKTATLKTLLLILDRVLQQDRTSDTLRPQERTCRGSRQCGLLVPGG